MIAQARQKMDDLLTTEELAQLCRVTPATVRWWRHVGRGPRGFTVAEGRRVLYARTDVDAWLSAARELSQAPELVGART